VRPKASSAGLICRTEWPMFSTPETSVHVLDKNREISPLEREEDYAGKDLEKRWVLRREWKTRPRDTPTTDLGAESEPGDGEHSDVADWQRKRRDEVCSIKWGAAYRKERLVILRLDCWACGWRRLTSAWRPPSGSWRLDIWYRKGNDIAKVMWTGRL